MAYDLIIFDCDGVLIDSEPLASATLAAALTCAGSPMTAHEALLTYTGQSESDIRLDLSRRGIKDTDSFLAGWKTDLFAMFADKLRPMPGIEALVKTIDQPVCVASNSGHERLQASLGQTSLWGYFTARVFSADDVDHPKPAPDLVRHCLEQCDARAEDSVMIDDSAHGIRAALSAGVTPIGFVDPCDPRPHRRERLAEAGATMIATGASELAQILNIPFADKATAPCPE